VVSNEKGKGRKRKDVLKNLVRLLLHLLELFRFRNVLPKGDDGIRTARDDVLLVLRDGESPNLQGESALVAERDDIR
jgi:hypothetical protein